jgi:hypothetical protein
MTNHIDINTVVSNLNSGQCFRLTASSGVPVTTTDQTAVTTLYVTPSLGNQVCLNNGGAWTPTLFTEMSVSVPSSQFRIYDLFGYYNSGALGIDTPLAWDSGGQQTFSITAATAANPCVVTIGTHSLTVGTQLGIAGIVGTLGTTAANGLNGKIATITAVTSTTITLGGFNTTSLTYSSGGTVFVIPSARTTGLTIASGWLTKTSDSTRLYLGSFMTTSTSGQTEASQYQQLIFNFYQQADALMQTNDTASTYLMLGGGLSGSYVLLYPRDNNTANGVGRNVFLCGYQQSPLTGLSYAATDDSDQNYYMAIGLNQMCSSTTPAPDACFPIAYNNTATGSFQYTLRPYLGCNYIQQLEGCYQGSGYQYWGSTGLNAIVRGIGAPATSQIQIQM